MIVCGPAQGTKARPYRCICCRRTFDDIEQLAVSICWDCMMGRIECQSCRRNGTFIADERVGRWNADLTYYDDEGGKGHRLVRLSRTNGIMACGERIPRAYFNQASGVVPWCGECWT